MAKLRLVLLGFGCILQGAVPAEAQSAASRPPAQHSARSLNTNYTVISRAADSRVWAAISTNIGPSGEVTVQSNGYTELASGLTYKKGPQWADAVEELETVADGAASSGQTRHSVHFAGNINVPKAIHLVSDDGKVFDSTVYGLSYWDRATGQSAVLARLQDSQGVMVGSNRVIYRDAFQGLKADVEYIFTKSGLEQNIIYREQIPPPESVGLTHSQNVRLQVLTEFFAPPVPRKTTNLNDGIVEDVRLNFGAMTIGVGKTFFTPGQDRSQVIGSKRVVKHWTKLDGRDFLIEEVPYTAVSNLLQKLPLHAAIAPDGSAVKHLASSASPNPGGASSHEPLKSPPHLASSNRSSARPSKPIQLAQAETETPGVVMDYSIVEAFAGYDFTAGTYFVSGWVCVDAGNGYDSVQFEPGAVIKFDGAPGTEIFVEGATTSIFNSTPANPVIFTDMSDDSVGDPIAGSTSTPTQGQSVYLFEMGGNGGSDYVTIANAKFRYAQNAYVDEDNDLSYLFSNCEFVDCGTNIIVSGPSISCANILSVGCSSFLGYTWGGPTCTLTSGNLTVDSCTQFVLASDGYNWGPCNGGIENSILWNCDGSIGNFNLPYTAVPDGWNWPAWQTSWLGDHYLPPNSPYLDAGDTTADQLGLSSFTTQTNQIPEGTTVVDLGYHFVPTDSSGNPLDANGNPVDGIAPSITLQPVSQSAIQSTSATFSVLATGTALGYQWYFNGTPIPGANGPTCTIANVQPVSAGSYSVLVANSYGSISSLAAVLSVLPAVTIITQPASQNVAPGGTALFSVTATGMASLSYQWTFNGTNIPGATASTYTVAPVANTNMGTYSVIVSDIYGSLASSNAVLGYPIQFSLSVTNAYVNVNPVPLSIALISGVPYYYSVLLDNTNFAAANWSSYTSSNITASLGGIQGWHTVWVGLSSTPAGAAAVWNSISLVLDTVRPVLVVTNSTNVMVPMIQLQGFASEELAGLAFDLTNANGAISNQPGYMIGAIYDTNHFLYTNSTFKCFDVALANGRNLVTLHAADLAGNVTTTNFNFTLNYSNKPPPVLQLYWPQNGTQIGGSNFTWRGTVNDPTVTLSAEVADGLGDSNVVAGVVERNGTFWVDNIPLFAGTNYLTLRAADVKSNVVTTNITVAQSPVVITINTPLSSPVSGTVNVSNYTVWVNGVQATQSGTAPAISWSCSAPLHGNGTTVAQVRAIPDLAADNYGNGTAGGGGANSGPSNPGNPAAAACVDFEAIGDLPGGISVDYYHHVTTGYWEGSLSGELWASDRTVNTVDWSAAMGGTSQSTDCTSMYISDPEYGIEPGSVYTVDQYQWDTNGNGLGWSGTSDNCGAMPSMGPPGGAYYTGPTSFGALQGQVFGLQSFDALDYQSQSESGNTRLKLRTGGRSLPGHQSLWGFSASGFIGADPYSNGEFTMLNTPSATTIMGESSPNAFYLNPPVLVSWGVGCSFVSGTVYKALADGETFDATAHVMNAAYFEADPSAAGGYPPQITFNSTNNVTYSNTTVIVGQPINLAFSFVGLDPSAVSNFSWTVPGTPDVLFSGGPTNGGPIGLTATSGSNLNTISFFWANSGTYTVTVTAQMGTLSPSATTTFTVVKPLSASIEAWPGPVAADNNYPGSGYYLHLGNGIAQPYFAGMYFNWNLTMPSYTTYNGGNTNYSIEWVQLVNSASLTYQTNNATGGIFHAVTAFTNSVLDTYYPYSNIVPRYNATIDSPGTPLYANATNAPYKTVSYSSAFTTWLMFQPYGGNLVPLVSLDWSWSGTATLTNVSSVGNYWILTSSNGPSHSYGSSTVTYPRWTNNITNLIRLPQ